MEKKPNTPENDIEKIVRIKKNAKTTSNSYIPAGFLKKYRKNEKNERDCFHMCLKGLTEHQVEVDEFDENKMMEDLIKQCYGVTDEEGTNIMEELEQEADEQEVEGKNEKVNDETCVVYMKNTDGETVQETIHDRFEEYRAKFTERCETELDENDVPIVLKNLLVPANITRDAEHDVKYIGTSLIYDPIAIEDAKNVKEIFVELKMKNGWSIIIEKKYGWDVYFLDTNKMVIPILNNVNSDLLLPEFTWMVDLGYKDIKQTAVDMPEETVDKITERRVQLPDKWFIHGQNSGVTRYVKGEKVNRTIMRYARMPPEDRKDPDIRNRDMRLHMDMSSGTVAKYFHLDMNITNVYTANHVKYNQPLFYGIKLNVAISIATQESDIKVRLYGLDDEDMIDMIKHMELSDFYIEFK